MTSCLMTGDRSGLYPFHWIGHVSICVNASRRSTRCPCVDADFFWFSSQVSALLPAPRKQASQQTMKLNYCSHKPSVLLCSTSLYSTERSRYSVRKGKRL